MTLIDLESNMANIKGDAGVEVIPNAGVEVILNAGVNNIPKAGVDVIPKAGIKGPIRRATLGKRVSENYRNLSEF